MRSIWSAGLLLIFLVCTCTNPPLSHNVNIIGYDLSLPDKTIILPPVLREISGLVVLDSSTVACIQDEKGIVYIFDLKKEQVTKEMYFTPDGDFEGICRVEQTLYVLKSNGMLFKVTNYETSSFSEKIELTGIRGDDNEGICYDKNNHSLLIVPKSKPGKNNGYRKKQPVYEYDLISGHLSEEAGLSIKTEDVENFLAGDEIVKTKKGKKKKSSGPEIILRPSEISIHPITGKLYLLSADEHLIVVFNSASEVEYVERLNPILFNQPEGIAFFENGDMLISNESGNKYPTILRYNYRK